MTEVEMNIARMMTIVTTAALTTVSAVRATATLAAARATANLAVARAKLNTTASLDDSTMRMMATITTAMIMIDNDYNKTRHLRLQIFSNQSELSILNQSDLSILNQSWSSNIPQN